MQCKKMFSSLGSNHAVGLILGLHLVQLLGFLDRTLLEVHIAVGINSQIGPPGVLIDVYRVSRFTPRHEYLRMI